MVTVSHSILARCRNHTSQLLKGHGVNDVRQTDKQSAEPLVSELGAFEFEMAFEKLKRHKPPDIDQIPVQFIKEGGRTICSEIHIDDGLKLNGTHQFLVYADDVYILGRSIHTIKKNTNCSSC